MCIIWRLADSLRPRHFETSESGLALLFEMFVVMMLEILLVSSFTLLGSDRRPRKRRSYSRAARPLSGEFAELQQDHLENEEERQRGVGLRFSH
jgi:D-Tyr-tRNAtyr deacylase